MQLFTKTQRKALLILVIILSASALIQRLSPHRIRQPIYDYSESDSLFFVLSKTLKDTTAFSGSSDAKFKHRIQSKHQIPENKKEILKPNSIRINTADKEQLQKLPRIGPKMAERIIQFRTEHGFFKQPADLMKVKGIGEKTLEKILPYISTK